jgi:hypothetical protein
VLKVLDGSVPKATVQATPLSREAVLAAFADYHTTCAALIPPEQQPALDTARAAFLKAIENHSAREVAHIGKAPP